MPFTEQENLKDECSLTFIMRLGKFKSLKRFNVEKSCGKGFLEVISHYTFVLVNRDLCPIVFQKDSVTMESGSGVPVLTPHQRKVRPVIANVEE